MEKNKLAIISFLIAIIIMSISSAATVEVTSGKLPAQLHEGDQVNFAIKITDFGEDTKSITIETSLISVNNKPIYDFGDLNPSITDNRYNQKITLNMSSLPQNNLQVSISGKSPEGETRIKLDKSDLIISKFSDTKLKFYEVRTDQKLAGIESFELIITKKEVFDNTLNKITWKGLDGVKREVKKLFDSGLTTEAQNIANEMGNIKIPNSLLLFGIIKVENDLWLNIIVVAMILLVFVIGYLAGSGGGREEEEET